MVDILDRAGQLSVDDFFADRPDLLRTFRPDLDYIWEMARAHTGRKGSGEKDTLAFHLLTIPEIILTQSPDFLGIQPALSGL